jgi:hypothetical protein
MGFRCFRPIRYISKSTYQFLNVPHHREMYRSKHYQVLDHNVYKMKGIHYYKFPIHRISYAIFLKCRYRIAATN